MCALYQNAKILKIFQAKSNHSVSVLKVSIVALMTTTMDGWMDMALMATGPLLNERIVFCIIQSSIHQLFHTLGQLRAAE